VALRERIEAEGIMARYMLDTVLRLRLKHQPGQLAALAVEVATHNALIGEIATLVMGEDESLRDVTIETFDEGHARRVVDCVSSMKGVEVLSVKDACSSFTAAGRSTAGAGWTSVMSGTCEPSTHPGWPGW
jgi:hypothetical protein